MKVYITYDRYERNEWFNIYQITTKMSEVKKDYKKNLFDFISYGPDDCHSFQVQIVEMTKQEYEQFMSWINEDQSLEDRGSNSSELFNKMVEIYEKVNENNTLLMTDGCSDNGDIIHYYGSKKGLDTDDDDIYYEVQEELLSDDDLFRKVLKNYINDTY